MVVIYLIPLVLSIVLNLFFQRYFIKKNKFDEVVLRSSHTVLATRSGGVAIFATLFLIIVYYYIQANQFFDFSVLIPLGILFTVGLYDDIYQVDFKLKFIFQLIVAKILVDQGIIIETLNGFLGIYEIPYLISQILTILLIIFIINATNFSDGIDGLAISESIKCLLIVIIASFNGKFLGYNFIFLLIIIATLPLYYFNFKRNYKVFLGDSGSLLLGGVISIALVVFINELGSITSSTISTPLILLGCFTYPIIDTIYVVAKRIANGKSPFIADKSHIHHIIINKGVSHNTCLLIISGITGIFQILLLYYITG